MENYSIINDFGGNSPNIGQLHNEIVLNNGITKNLIGITIHNNDDNVIIEFDFSLSIGEKTILDGIVSSHIAVFIPDLNYYISVNIKNNKIKNETFERIGIEQLPGTTYAKATCISYMNSGPSSYNIAIFDKTNKQFLLNVNLSNTTETIQDLGYLTNLSSSNSQIELLIKKNGGNGYINIENFLIYYK